MANATDPFAESVHGTNPQNLIEKITRLKIYNSTYWKEHCFGLTAETIIDKAISLKYCGGTYAGNVKPTAFLCLCLKLLQLQPEKDIVIEYIHNEDFKYLRLLGAFYLRMTGKPVEIYKHLEPLYNDYRKVAYRGMGGWEVMHIDEFVDALLYKELVCDVALPHLPRRVQLEDAGLLEPRVSALEDMVGSDDEEEEEMRAASPSRSAKNQKEPSQSAIATEALLQSSELTSLLSSSQLTNLEAGDSALHRVVVGADRETQSDGGNRREKHSPETRGREQEYRGGREGRREWSRERGSNSRRGRRGRSHSSSSSSSVSTHSSRSRSRSSGKYGRRRRDSRRRQSRSRERERESRRNHGDRRRSRSRDTYREKERGRDRDGHYGSSRNRRSRDRRSSRSRSYERSRDRHSRRDSSRSRDRDRRDRERESCEDKHGSRHTYRDSRRESLRDSERENSGIGSESVRPRGRESREGEQSRQNEPGPPEEDDDDDFMPEIMTTTSDGAQSGKPEKLSTKKFDRIMGKAKKSSNGGVSKGIKEKGPGGAITAPEGSVEYWNQMRESLGLKKLKE